MDSKIEYRDVPSHRRVANKLIRELKKHGITAMIDETARIVMTKANGTNFHDAGPLEDYVNSKLYEEKIEITRVMIVVVAGQPFEIQPYCNLVTSLSSAWKAKVMLEQISFSPQGFASIGYIITNE